MLADLYISEIKDRIERTIRAFTSRHRPIGGQVADNWPFKATSKMELTPNIPPVYRQRCETAALAWPLTKDFVCVWECKDAGSGGDSNGVYLMHQGQQWVPMLNPSEGLSTARWYTSLAQSGWGHGSRSRHGKDWMSRNARYCGWTVSTKRNPFREETSPFLRWPQCSKHIWIPFIVHLYRAISQIIASAGPRVCNVARSTHFTKGHFKWNIISDWNWLVYLIDAFIDLFGFKIEK